MPESHPLIAFVAADTNEARNAQVRSRAKNARARNSFADAIATISPPPSRATAVLTATLGMQRPVPAVLA